MYISLLIISLFLISGILFLLISLIDQVKDYVMNKEDIDLCAAIEDILYYLITILLISYSLCCVNESGCYLGDSGNTVVSYFEKKVVSLD